MKKYLVSFSYQRKTNQKSIEILSHPSEKSCDKKDKYQMLYVEKGNPSTLLVEM